jgi:putative redox protein
MEHSVEAVHRGGMRFEVAAGPHSVTMDYPLAAEESGVGARPLDMLLASLASCAGGAVVVLLRRAGQPVAGLRVRARGERRTQHPTVFTRIVLEFAFAGPADAAAIARAIEQSEEHVCPVWAMLKAGTPITSSFRIDG